MLKEYIENVVSSIITEKEIANNQPLCATQQEIMRRVSEDVIDCMRQLHIEGKFKGGKTVNQIPTLYRIQ